METSNQQKSTEKRENTLYHRSLSPNVVVDKKSEKHKYTTHEQTQKKKSHPLHRRRIFLFLGFSDGSLGRGVVTARESV